MPKSVHDHYAELLGPVYTWMVGDIDAAFARLDFKEHLTAPVDVILCMGDTLTHLQDQSSVKGLLNDAAASLKVGRVLVATFRDYVTAPLKDEARFIPVRSDTERILTCFLEYAETTVTVHDILHQREAGSWRQHVSSYRKLRLAPQWAAQQLVALGLEVVSDTVPGRMLRITALKAR